MIRIATNADFEELTAIFTICSGVATIVDIPKSNFVNILQTISTDEPILGRFILKRLSIG